MGERKAQRGWLKGTFTVRLLSFLVLGDIAEQLGCDRNTITSAIRWWHEDRVLPVSDGRTRRKELKVKSSPKTKDASSDTDDPQSEKK